MNQLYCLGLYSIFIQNIQANTDNDSCICLSNQLWSISILISILSILICIICLFDNCFKYIFYKIITKETQKNNVHIEMI